MLNQSRVLNYIKSNLGFPFSHIEFDDDDCDIEECFMLMEHL